MGTVGSRNGVQFGIPKTGTETWRRPPPSRVCARIGCSTILSTYNRSATCFIHADRPSMKRPYLTK
jgi:hypothetical protein